MGLRDARGRDHLLGLEDLLHALGGTDPLLVNPLLGSHVSPRAGGCVLRRVPPPGRRHLASAADDLLLLDGVGAHAARDRKSTRLNSSHVATSYAVFCLKKKNRPHFVVPANHRKRILCSKSVASTQ